MTFRASLAAVGFLTLAAAAGGACDRTYLTPTHGRSYRQAFAVQAVNPDAQRNNKAVVGLDSQEASIISGSYRKSLAPQQEASQNQGQLLTYSRNNAALREASAVPASSVPQGQ